jgi:hypothetical protein
MIRNNSTGATYNLGAPSGDQGAAQGPQADYARPIEMAGLGKGYYIKGDPMAALIGGKRVDLGRDTDKERAINAANLKMDEGRQKLREGEVDIALKNQRLGLPSIKPPPNYRWTADGNLERIPGGAADEKVVNAFNGDTMALQTATSSLDNLLETAHAVLKAPGLAGNYGIQGMVTNIPGGEAANAKALIDKLKDQAGFGALNDLKSAGKNGSSGLGQVTEFEHKILQKQLANLDKAQSVEHVKTEIAKLVSATENTKSRLFNHYQTMYGKMLGDSPIAAPKVEEPVGDSPPAPGRISGFGTLPDAKAMEGKVIRDTHTGKRMRASNGRWSAI